MSRAFLKKEKSQRELDKLLEVGSYGFSPSFFHEQTGRSERVMTQFGREEKQAFQSQNIECVLLDGQGIWALASDMSRNAGFNAARTFTVSDIIASRGFGTWRELFCNDPPTHRAASERPLQGLRFPERGPGEGRSVSSCSAPAMNNIEPLC